jgi:hypothetical protein
LDHAGATGRSVRVGQVPETVVGVFYRRPADGVARHALLAMSTLDIAIMRVDRANDPTVIGGSFRTVEWPFVPREGESIDLGHDYPLTVESVGNGFNG